MKDAPAFFIREQRTKAMLTTEIDREKRELLQATLDEAWNRGEITYRVWYGDLPEGYHVIEFYWKAAGHDSILYITARKALEEIEFFQRYEYWLTLPEGAREPIQDQEFIRFKILFPVGAISRLLKLCSENWGDF